jgi:hypothetical protein
MRARGEKENSFCGEAILFLVSINEVRFKEDEVEIVAMETRLSLIAPDSWHRHPLSHYYFFT